MIYVPEFGGEGKNITAYRGLDSCVVVPAESLAEAVNNGTDEVIAIINGAFVTGPLGASDGIVSPYVRRGSQVDAWWEPVSPLAFCLRRETLERMGGFPDMMFEYHRVLGHVAGTMGIPCEASEEAVAEAMPHLGRQEAIGNLYYTQLQDQRKYNQLAGL